MVIFRILLVSVLAISCVDGFGQVENISISGQEIIIVMDNLEYPDYFLKKDIISGLPNVIDFHIRINGNEQVSVSDILVRYTLQYDLWDDIFRLKVQRENDTKTFEFTDRSDFVRYIRQVKISASKNLRVLSGQSTIKFEVQAFLNPLTQERMEKVKNWVVQHNAYNRTATSNSKRSGISPVVSSEGLSNTPNNIISQVNNTSQTRSNGPAFSSLFNQILDQYTAGDDVVAEWRSELLIFEIDNL